LDIREVIKQEVGDNCIMRSFITFILFPKYNWNDQVKGDKKVRAWGEVEGYQ
jgi:hypothetical protein